jgi:hypothetical protein
MVNVEKQRTKALIRFKNTHINNIVGKNLTTAKREEGDIIYEDIILVGKVVGTFVFNKAEGKLYFEEAHVLPVE